MKKITWFFKIGMSLALVLSSITVLSAQESEGVDIETQDNEYRDGDGFENIESFDMNPRLRGIEGASYTRNGNYLVYAKGEKSLYSNHSSYSKVLAYIKAGEVMVGTKRYGDYVYVSSSKGKGWIYVANTSAKLMEVENINTPFKTTVSTTVYKQPFIESRFKTSKRLSAGTYKAVKRASYFVYVTSGSTSGWISTQYNDSSKNIGKIGGTFTSTKSSLSVSSVGGIKLYKKFIPRINDAGRPGIPMIPKYVTIHNTDNSSRGANASAHANLQYSGNSRRASWHFQVDNKTIYQSVPMNESAWHAGDGNTMGNASTIAIEICENSDGNYAQAEKNAAKLTARILYENNLPATAVKLHKDWSGKNCAHNIIQKTKGSLGWTAFKALVKKEYDNLGSTIRLNVSKLSMNLNTSYQLKASFSPSSVSSTALTWSSSNASIVSVNSKGLITARKKGTAVITAKNAGGKTAKATVSVKGPSLTLKQYSATIYPGSTIKLIATPQPNSAITWKSSDQSIASVDASGNVSGKKKGIAYISATANGVTTTCKVTVNNPFVRFKTNNLTVYKGYTAATPYETGPANGKVVFTSSNPAVAYPSGNSIVGKKVGTTQIKATWNGLTATMNVTVKNPYVRLNSYQASLYKGYTTTLKATSYPSTKVTWRSANNAIATVSSKGTISGKKPGTTYVYAAINGANVSCKVVVKASSVKISKTKVSVYTGIFGYTLKASATPKVKVKWKSSNTLIATVNSSGFVTGKKAGTVSITAYVNGASKSCRMTFKAPSRAVKSIKLNATRLDLNKVRKYRLKVSYNPSKATLKKVKWTTSNAKVATVNSSGYVTAKKKGTTYITATAHNGVKKSIKVVVYR